MAANGGVGSTPVRLARHAGITSPAREAGVIGAPHFDVLEPARWAGR